MNERMFIGLAAVAALAAAAASGPEIKLARGTADKRPLHPASVPKPKSDALLRMLGKKRRKA